MCGIFGLIIREREADWARFHQLAQHNRQRGNLGFGVVAADSNLNRAKSHPLTVYRATCPYSDPVAGLNQLDNNVLLGHIRAPTGRRTRSIQEIHPFESGQFLLAHNGLLLNHLQYPHWRVRDDVDVDSQYLLGGVTANFASGLALPTAISITASTLEGQQGCWLWDKNAGQLYLWRVMSPIYTHFDGTQFLFSSLSFDPNASLLEEGIVYRFDPLNWAFHAVEHFEFYSPYL